VRKIPILATSYLFLEQSFVRIRSAGEEENIIEPHTFQRIPALFLNRGLNSLFLYLKGV
jgi:hypothetical protein